MTFTDTTTTTSAVAGYLLVAIILIAGLTGCDSFTDGFDENPNLPTDATPENILNSAQVATILFQEGDHARIASFWSEQLDGSDRQYAGQDRPGYNLTATDVNNIWITGYADAIGDLKVVQEKAEEQQNPRVQGIAQVVEAWIFGAKAALHGDVPFEDAGQGREDASEDGNEFNPRFDPQLDVYAGTIQLLDDAIANLEENVPADLSPGALDIFYGGDADAWIQAANTIKARYMLHVAHVDEGPVADYGFQEVYETTLNGISDPSVDLIAPHGEALDIDANTFWHFRNDRGDDLTAQGSYAARLLDADTELYRGDDKTDESARFNNYFVGEDPDYDMNLEGFFARGADYPIVTYVENELIKAEAALHSGQELDVALDALNNARAANEARFGGTYEAYDLADFESGGIANPEGESQAAALLREILEEKYLSVFANIETYNDLRRTENFIEVQDGNGNVVTMDELPQRFPIAQSEVTGNDNVPDPIPSIQSTTPANQPAYPTP